MNVDTSLFGYFLHAGLVVKIVMLILGTASVFSWSYILQRSAYLKALNKNAAQFEQAFWSGEDLSRLYNDAARDPRDRDGLPAVFHAGFKEFNRFRKQAGASREAVLDNTQRAMKVAQMREQDKLETHLPFLATVASISPYVGLFGTVWGIMESFHALANVQQATISMVAPGISEALIATALGLFAAIPAGIAYSRLVTEIGRLMGRFEAFQEEFTNILVRQTQSATDAPSTARAEPMGV